MMDEITELAELHSPTGGPVLDILMVLQRVHGELLEIYDDAINKINGGETNVKNSRGN